MTSDGARGGDLRQNGRMPRLRTLAPIAVLLVLAGLLAACGGGADLASDPGKVLADAKLPPAGPNQSTLRLAFTPQAAGGATTAAGDGLGGLLGGPIEIDAATQGDAATGVTADGKAAVGPLEVPFSFRQNAAGAWVQIGGTWYALGEPLGIDFGALAQPLGDVSQLMADPQATAVEEVGGIQCDRITGTLKPGAAIADQLGGLAGSLPLDLTALQSGKAQLSVWVGRDDHVIHRVQIDSAAAESSDGGLLVDLSVVPSEPIPVEAPQGAKPLSALLTTVLGRQAGEALGGVKGLGDLGALLQSGELDLSGLLGGAGGGLSGLLGGGGATAS